MKYRPYPHPLGRGITQMKNATAKQAKSSLLGATEQTEGGDIAVSRSVVDGKEKWCQQRVFQI